jgi:hypothetical protein
MNWGVTQDCGTVHLCNGDKIMPVSQPRFNANETVQRAKDLYEQRLRQKVEADHRGQYIAIDIDTGDYEIGSDYDVAAHTILFRKPDAAIGVLRIGYPAVGRIGGRVRPIQP